MNKEEIIKLAREVGLLPDNLHPAPQTHHMAQKQKNLETFAALVAAREREACAELCEEHIGEDLYDMFGKHLAKQCAEAIRERSEQ
jgi:adenylyl- and sulfurtransferase ThiI